ncbi:alanine racemase [Costertonia aggregata]|uniref:Alanine racemase n=1 Tax=Costertonia aggregata TaxID=343403 RepID=A0A7H9APX0_9FLAO|nr:alanine racemase [Costertonia aggregata]QLG45443.1 alanine racemase [Costertonia aggregata]
MSEVKETVLEIDFKALEHNYLYLRSKLLPKTKFLAVVKAFAYGSDAEKVALKLQSLGADYFAVAYVKEGIALRDAGITRPILVLHPQAVSFDTLIERCLEPSIYSRKILEAFLETAAKHEQKEYPVHLKFNTGLNRLGFGENDIDFIIGKLKGTDYLKALSIFSHLAASEDLNEKEFTKKQIDTFQKIASEIDKKLDHIPFKHLLNTSGIVNYPGAQHHMVRSGIGLYGYGNEAKIDAQLRPVVTLKTIISQIHKIKPGETVGYNRAYASDGYKISATLPLGHADGIGRQYGNGKTYVYVNGKKAPIIGNVCMDMIMIDVTNINCNEGDEVIVFGKGLSANDFAQTADTISYELLTGISQRVKRSFIE